MSYVGLFRYYQFDNWAYQASYVSSNTPWFFNGMHIQVFPTDKLKIEPWIINGWQSCGKFNKAPGAGLLILWETNGSVSLLGNQYFGTDPLGFPTARGSTRTTASRSSITTGPIRIWKGGIHFDLRCRTRIAAE